MSNPKKFVKVVVLCTNSNGSPEFHTCAIECSQEDVDNGSHYDRAKENASWNGFQEPMMAFDANDEAAKQFLSIYGWISRDIHPEKSDVTCNDPLNCPHCSRGAKGTIKDYAIDHHTVGPDSYCVWECEWCKKFFSVEQTSKGNFVLQKEEDPPQWVKRAR